MRKLILAAVLLTGSSALAQQTLEKHIAQASGDLDLRKKAVEDLVKPINDALKLYQEKNPYRDERPGPGGRSPGR